MLWGPGAGLHCTHMAITQNSSAVFLLKDRRLEHLFTSSIPHSLKVAWGQGETTLSPLLPGSFGTGKPVQPWAGLSAPGESEPS